MHSSFISTRDSLLIQVFLVVAFVIFPAEASRVFDGKFDIDTVNGILSQLSENIIDFACERRSTVANSSVSTEFSDFSTSTVMSIRVNDRVLLTHSASESTPSKTRGSKYLGATVAQTSRLIQLSDRQRERSSLSNSAPRYSRRVCIPDRGNEKKITPSATITRIHVSFAVASDYRTASK